MTLYQEYSVAAQTAFAGLDDAARQADLKRSVADLPGGFAKKVVSGRAYWYYQVKTPDGELRQSYVGPDDDATRALIQRHADPAAKLARQQLVRLGRAAVELGCADIPPKHARVIERLADAGLFSAGGILVGTHAFLAYQNILGVRWSAGAATLDLDFAHAGRNVSLALPENLKLDTRETIESLQMGFVPNQKRTSFKKTDEPDFDLDFLTSRGRGGDEPVTVPRLNLTMQPLRFMELSLQDPVRSTLLARSGPIVVNIPRPQRYALHKLLVYGERPQGQRTKARKDLAQAAALMDYLLLHDAIDIAQLWVDVNARGPGWRRRLGEGFEMMLTLYPDCDFKGRLDQALARVP
ncbi:nucleotidyltransferase domain-containing protein [Polaromonas sp.]|uniref:nucleotidyltransferase domain-containing protein n=1 Tax=Polaromonas sp. TaxID=1869339 RepID=UPI00286B0AAC|nr:nucleotidyltransferase domain-containing protein [Polaromonas sp.]